MDNHETIADKAAEWNSNVEKFVDSLDRDESIDTAILKDGLHGIIAIAEEQSVDGWCLADESCPDCREELVFDHRGTTVVTRHKNNEVRYCDGGNSSTHVAYECCECEQVLMTSPCAVVSPALPGEIQKNLPVDEQQTQLLTDFTADKSSELNTSKKQELGVDMCRVDKALDILSEMTVNTGWDLGEPSVFVDNDVILETPIAAYPSKISNGVAHCDTMGEELTTLTYTCSSTGKRLLESTSGLLYNRFNLN